jgi:hypothetical protein
VFLEINDLFSKFNDRVKAEKIPETTIQAIICHSFFAVENIKTSYTVDPRVEKFLDFKKKNESLFIFIDKTPYICYIRKKDYDLK